MAYRDAAENQMDRARSRGIARRDGCASFLVAVPEISETIDRGVLGRRELRPGIGEAPKNPHCLCCDKEAGQAVELTVTFESQFDAQVQEKKAGGSS